MDNCIWKFIEESSLNDYTLLVPSVAVGNVAQLTCDLLISSLNMKKIASVYSPAQIPVVGYDPYDLKSTNLSSSCELYKSELKKICILQVRSPLLLKYAKTFLEEVIDVFQKKQIRDIIILTSSFAHEKKHIPSSHFTCVVSQDNEIYKENIKATDVTVNQDNDGEIKIFGGGFAGLLYKICVLKHVPSLVLFKYCSEGDNIPDAYDMVKNLATILPLFSEEKDLYSQLTPPVSWNFLFGRPAPQDIY